jgi:hypothetical protein
MEILTFPSRAVLVCALFAATACGSDPATKPIKDNSSEDDGDVTDADDVTDDTATDDDTAPTSSKDAGKGADNSKMDAGKTATKDAGSSASDAGRSDAGGIDSGLDAGSHNEPDASPSEAADAGVEVDAGSVQRDAGTNTRDAGDAPRDAGGNVRDAGRDAGATGAGTCSGSTPHGCYVAASDNDKDCPPQIHEQSEYYPPRDEWVECSSPYYERCNYAKPTGGAAAHCECDLGLHWLCTY